MLVQAKAVVSDLHSVPEGLTNRSFCFSSVFRLGGPDSTNVSRRGQHFGDKFLDVADGKCCMPKKIKHVDIGSKGGDLRDSVHLEDHQLWDSRVPLKLVGHLKDHQKNGGQGPLLINGHGNYFLCRNSKNLLEIVELKYINDSWQVDSTECVGNISFDPHSRIFAAVR